MSSQTWERRIGLAPTWWAPLAVICVVGLWIGAMVPIMAGQVGGLIAFPVSAVGLPAAVLGVIRERRLGWRIAAVLAGLVHLAVALIFAFVLVFWLLNT